MTVKRYDMRRTVDRKADAMADTLKALQFGNAYPVCSGNLYEDQTENLIPSDATTFTPIHWDLYRISNELVFEAVIDGGSGLLTGMNLLQEGLYVFNTILDWDDLWTGVVRFNYGFRKEHGGGGEYYGLDFFYSTAFVQGGTMTWNVGQDSGSDQQLAGTDGATGANSSYCQFGIAYLGALSG